MTPLAWCVSGHEGGHDFSIDDGNGYYGSFQFTYSTWLAAIQAMKVVGWPTRADLATPAQQTAAFTFWWAIHPSAWQADWATCGGP